ncbi:hypothetical protein RA2_02614 [Roseovarius sp. A-2]|nr:hypothetical protein RA2_02614 [Roseovarius sp. A-2]
MLSAPIGQIGGHCQLEEYGFAWKWTPGAIDWLLKATKDLIPEPRGHGPVQ